MYISPVMIVKIVLADCGSAGVLFPVTFGICLGSVLVWRAGFFALGVCPCLVRALCCAFYSDEFRVLLGRFMMVRLRVCQELYSGHVKVPSEFSVLVRIRRT